MKLALKRIHNVRFIHSDIARRNFCIAGSHVYPVDLETVVVGSSDQAKAEIAAVNEL